MAFKRKKTVNGREYWYIVENYRQNGKVKQRTLAYLGTCGSATEAVAKLGEKAEMYRGWADSFREQADHPRGKGLHRYRKQAGDLKAAETNDRRAEKMEARVRHLSQFVGADEVDVVPNSTDKNVGEFRHYTEAAERVAAGDVPAAAGLARIRALVGGE